MADNGSDQGAQGTVQQVKKQVKDKTRLVTDVAGAVVGERVRTEIGTQSSTLGVETEAFARVMREASHTLHEQGHHTQASLAEDLADRADRVAAYLSGADAKRLIADGKNWGREAGEFAKREPLLVMAGVFTLGLLATRWLGSDDS